MPSARMASVSLQCLQVALQLLTAKTNTAFKGIEIRWALLKTLSPGSLFWKVFCKSKAMYDGAAKGCRACGGAGWGRSLGYKQDGIQKTLRDCEGQRITCREREVKTGLEGA